MDSKSFLEGYQVTDIEKDPLPIKVLRNSIVKEEIPGQALHWAFDYLDQRSCPLPLSIHIIEKLHHEVCQTDFSHCSESSGDSVDSGIESVVRYEPLKLMRAVVNILDNICMKEREDFQDSVDGVVESPDMLPHVFAVSYNNIKNTRRFMEDRMTILPRMDRIFKLHTPVSYFAVFDGHNGSEAAAYGAAQLHQYLIQCIRQSQDIIPSIHDAFERLDAVFVQKCQSGKVKSGSTAVLSLVMPETLYVAWVGDSQAVLVKQNEISNLVTPHKPERPDEIERIRRNGGEVFQMNGTYRVNGNLAVSRAIGDADDKEFIISTPDIKMLELDGTEEFLILACDGLWDEISPEASAEIVRHQVVNDPNNIASVSQKLVKNAKQCGSTDNISVIVVFLEPVESIRNRYENVLGTELDISSLKKPSQKSDGKIMDLNGHGKDTDQLVEFLSFGSSKEGAQIQGNGESHSDDDLDIKEVEEDLSDAASDDEWQFEKPNANSEPINMVINNGEPMNNQFGLNPFAEQAVGSVGEIPCFNQYTPEMPNEPAQKVVDGPGQDFDFEAAVIAVKHPENIVENQSSVDMMMGNVNVLGSDERVVTNGNAQEIAAEETQPVGVEDSKPDENAPIEAEEMPNVIPDSSTNFAGEIVVLNGEGKDSDQLVDFMSFGNSKEGAQVQANGEICPEENADTNKEDFGKDLGDAAAPNDKLQVEKLDAVPQPTTMPMNIDDVVNNQFSLNPFAEPGTGYVEDMQCFNQCPPEISAGQSDLIADFGVDSTSANQYANIVDNKPSIDNIMDLVTATENITVNESQSGFTVEESAASNGNVQEMDVSISNLSGVDQKLEENETEANNEIAPTTTHTAEEEIIDFNGGGMDTNQLTDFVSTSSAKEGAQGQGNEATPLSESADINNDVEKVFGNAAFDDEKPITDYQPTNMSINNGDLMNAGINKDVEKDLADAAAPTDKLQVEKLETDPQPTTMSMNNDDVVNNQFSLNPFAEPGTGPEVDIQSFNQFPPEMPSGQSNLVADERSNADLMFDSSLVAVNQPENLMENPSPVNMDMAPGIAAENLNGNQSENVVAVDEPIVTNGNALEAVVPPKIETVGEVKSKVTAPKKAEIKPKVAPKSPLKPDAAAVKKRAPVSTATSLQKKSPTKPGGEAAAKPGLSAKSTAPPKPTTSRPPTQRPILLKSNAPSTSTTASGVGSKTAASARSLTSRPLNKIPKEGETKPGPAARPAPTTNRTRPTTAPVGTTGARTAASRPTTTSTSTTGTRAAPLARKPTTASGTAPSARPATARLGTANTAKTDATNKAPVTGPARPRPKPTTALSTRTNGIPSTNGKPAADTKRPGPSRVAPSATTGSSAARPATKRVVSQPGLKKPPATTAPSTTATKVPPAKTSPPPQVSEDNS